MVSTIRYSANASSDHHPNQVPGILIIMNPKQPNLPTCSVTSTYLLFHLLSNPSLHLIANTTLGIIMTAIKISPKTLNHSILSTITNFDLLLNFVFKLYHKTCEQFYRNFGLYEKSPNSFLPGLPRSIAYQFCFHNFLCLCLASVHLTHPFHLVFSFQLLGHAVLLCQ